MAKNGARVAFEWVAASSWLLVWIMAWLVGFRYPRIHVILSGITVLMIGTLPLWIVSGD